MGMNAPVRVTETNFHAPLIFTPVYKART